MIERAPGRTSVGAILLVALRSMYAISPWNFSASQRWNCPMCGGAAAVVMPTRSNPSARARRLISMARASASDFSVDADDFIGLLLHGHGGGIDAMRDGLVQCFALAQQRFDPRAAISIVLE